MKIRDKITKVTAMFFIKKWENEFKLLSVSQKYTKQVKELIDNIDINILNAEDRKIINRCKKSMSIMNIYY